jgi:hypothetical protein
MELRRIFGPKREEVTGEWRKLQNELNLYSSPDIRMIKSRQVRWVGPVAHMGEMRNKYKVLVSKSGRQRPLGIPRCVWEDNTETYFRELTSSDVDWICLFRMKTMVGS